MKKLLSLLIALCFLPIFAQANWFTDIFNKVNLTGGSGTVDPLPVRTFTGLRDTPNTYVGSAGDLVQVNASSTGLTFASSSIFLSTTTAASTYVPYTGASTTVDLGSQSLITTGTSSVGNLFVNSTTPFTTGNFQVTGKNSGGNYDFIGLFTEAGITPEQTTLGANGNKRALVIEGAGAAYMVGRDVTNDIEFIMGTSNAGVVFMGSMTNHALQFRINNAYKAGIDIAGTFTNVGSIQTTSGNINLGNDSSTYNPIIRLYGYDSAETITKLSYLQTTNTGNFKLFSSEDFRFFVNGSGGSSMWLTTEGNLVLGASRTASYARLDVSSVDGNAFERIAKLGTGSVSVTGAGAYIEFPSSTIDGYGARIGGIRDGSGGANAIVIQTGTNAQTTKFKVNDLGRTLITNNIALAESVNISSSPIRFLVQSNTANEYTASFISTTGTGASSGSGITGFTDLATATVSGDRLGYLYFGGAIDNTHSLRTSAGMATFADGNWSSTSLPSYITFQTTPAGSTTKVDRAKIGSNGLSEFYGINTSTLPQLGNATYASFLMARTGRQYGIAYGVKDNTGEGWIQAQRFDGTATAYDLLLQPSGGYVKRGIEQSIVSGTIFTQTADKTVGNTTTETSLVGTGSGSMTLPANTLKAGTTLKVKMRGYISGTNGHNATVRIKIGSTTLITSVASMPATITNAYFDVDLDITCRTAGASGTVIAQGKTTINAGVGLTTSYTRALQMTSTATIDTTASQTLDATYEWGTASTDNTITSTNLDVNILR